MMDTFKVSKTLMDHVQNPRNNGRLKNYNGHAKITGPCGDTMEMWLFCEDQKVMQAHFTTTGCGPSYASGSMATCLAEGKMIPAAAQVSQRDILEALGGLPQDSEHCALLASDTLKAACEDYRRNGETDGRDPEKRTGDGAGSRRPGESEEDFRDRCRVQARLDRIGRKIVVLSGKGGVGKSTVAVNLAVALAQSGKRVGLIDADIHGPSVPTLMGLDGKTVRFEGGELVPVLSGGIKVLSIGFFLPDPDEAVIWRGPKKMGAIKQFLTDAAWGDLDFLIVDSPPGTGDEPLSVCQLIGNVDGALIVTTPQRVSTVDVRKSVTFCRRLNVPVLGVIENMSGYVCPHCGGEASLFKVGGGERMARDMKVPFLGSIPVDPAIGESGDAGRPFVSNGSDGKTARVFRKIAQDVMGLCAETRR
ncbi:MAG TPA: P-loop NTPase [Elusimicrobiota bacterium]|nr:P-loop NTPase [Elusimicrobiota bacterium]